MSEPLAGVLVLCKPPGMTSHDCVAAVRRLLHVRRAGHTGTLDPGAAGVLPICLGGATRLAEYLSGADKEYRAWVSFGSETDTLDAGGRVVERRPADHVDAAAVSAALPRFTGFIEQVPPMVSAVKVGGQRLYRAAMAGRQVDRPPRRVRIDRLELLQFGPGPNALLRVVCGAGTYVRALAADLGRALDTVAHVAFLLRARSGPFRLEASATLQEVAAAAAAGALASLLVSGSEALRHLPALAVDFDRAATLRRDGLWRWGADAPAAQGELFRIVDPGGELVAVARAGPGGRPAVEKVFHAG